jgi:hypothetical protein
MATSLWTGHWRGNSPNGDAHRRSREVISPSGGIMRCKFPSRKNGRLVHCEGLLELDAAYLFEASPQIAVYREQPAKTHIPDGDRVRRYTPDFELTLTTGESVWIEVKPLRSLENPDVRHRLKMVREHMARSERRFAIFSDDVLRLEPRQANLRQIFHRAGPTSPTVDAAVVGLRRCAEELPAPLHRATALLAKAGLQPYSLLLMGLLRCDLSVPLGPDALITLASEDDDGWFRLSQEHHF